MALCCVSKMEFIYYSGCQAKLSKLPWRKFNADVLIFDCSQTHSDQMNHTIWLNFSFGYISKQSRDIALANGTYDFEQTIWVSIHFVTITVNIYCAMRFSDHQIYSEQTTNSLVNQAAPVACKWLLLIDLTGIFCTYRKLFSDQAIHLSNSGSFLAFLTQVRLGQGGETASYVRKCLKCKAMPDLTLTANDC